MPTTGAIPEGDLGAYAKAISFRLVPPTRRPWRRWDAIDRRMKRVGLPLEVVNTRLPEAGAETRRYLQPLLRMHRLSTYPIAAIIQHAVRTMPRDRVYLNVGVWHGFSLFAGMAGNADRRCVGVDNFSEIYAAGSFGDVRAAFLEEFERRRSPLHEFHDLDYRDYFERVHDAPIGLYAYDADHAYEHQLRGLELADPFLASGAAVLIDDAYAEPVRAAALDFIAAQPSRYDIAFDEPVASKAHPTYWGGILILRRR
jgi:hypothetical protein